MNAFLRQMDSIEMNELNRSGLNRSGLNRNGLNRTIDRRTYAEALLLHVSYCQASDSSVLELLHALTIAIEEGDLASQEKYLLAMSSLLFALGDTGRLIETTMQVHAAQCQAEGRSIEGIAVFEQLRSLPQIEVVGAVNILRSICDFLLGQGLPQEVLTLLQWVGAHDMLTPSQMTLYRIRCAVALQEPNVAWGLLPSEAEEAFSLEWLDALLPLLILRITQTKLKERKGTPHRGTSPPCHEKERRDTYRVAAACWTICNREKEAVSSETMGKLADVFISLKDYPSAGACADMQRKRGLHLAEPLQVMHSYAVSAICHYHCGRLQDAIDDATKELEISVARGYRAMSAHKILCLVYTRMGAAELGKVHSVLYASSPKPISDPGGTALEFFLEYASELSQASLHQQSIEAATTALAHCPNDELTTLCAIRRLIAKARVTMAGLMAPSPIEEKKSIVQQAINACFDYKTVATKLHSKDDTTDSKLLLGVCYVFCKQYRKAIRSLTECIDDVNTPAAHGALARSHFFMKTFNKALEHFQRQVTLGREARDEIQVTQGLEGLGDVALEQNEWDTALGHYSEELSILSNPEEERGPSSTADALIPSTVLMPSQSFAEFQAYKKLGETYRRMGRLDTCLTYFHQALTIATKNPSLKAHVYAINGEVGKIHMERYDYENACINIEAAMKGAHSSADSESHTNFLAMMCQAAFLMRDWDKCIRSSVALEEIAKAEDHKILSISLRGSCLVELGRMKQASDLVDELRKLVVEKSDSEVVSHSVLCSALHTISSVLCWSQRFKEALPVYQQWISLSEKKRDAVGALDHIKAHFGHANCHFFLINHLAAFTEYSRVMDLVDAYLERSLPTMISERTIRQLNIFATQAIHWVMTTRWEVRHTQTVDEMWTRNKAHHRFFQHYLCKNLLQSDLRHVSGTIESLGRRGGGGGQRLWTVLYSATHEVNMYRILVQCPEGLTQSRASLRAPVFSTAWEGGTLSAKMLRALYDALWAPIVKLLPSFELTTDRIVVCPDSQLLFVPFQSLLNPRGKYVVQSHPPLVVCPSMTFLRVASIIAPDPRGATGVVRLNSEITTRKEFLTVLGTHSTVIVEGRTALKGASVDGAAWSGSLAVADGTVQAHEITQRGTHSAQLVVLRACTFDLAETEGGRVPFPLAFLSSGSRNVLCAMSPMGEAGAITKSHALVNDFVGMLSLLQHHSPCSSHVALAWHLVSRAALKRKVPAHIVAAHALLGLP